MKNLANCTPLEFIKQTNRIKKALEKWMKDVNIREIRQRMPELEVAKADATKEEKVALMAKNKQRVKDQAMKNLSDILDGAFEKFPEETLEILALFCFIEPEDVNNHSMKEYLVAITELINDEAVIGFFTSFLSLAQKNGLTA